MLKRLSSVVVAAMTCTLMLTGCSFFANKTKEPSMSESMQKDLNTYKQLNDEKDAVLSAAQGYVDDFNKLVSDEDLNWLISKSEDLGNLADLDIDVAAFLRDYFSSVKLTIDNTTTEIRSDGALVYANFSYKSLETFVDKLEERLSAVDEATAQRIRQDGTGGAYILQVMQEVLAEMPQVEASDTQLRLIFKKSGDTYVPDDMRDAIITVVSQD